MRSSEQVSRATIQSPKRRALLVAGGQAASDKMRVDFANSRAFTADDKIIPDPEDYRAIERKFGRLPDNASDARRTQYHRLAQAQKLMRLSVPS
jgi:hypothetical protein